MNQRRLQERYQLCGILPLFDLTELSKQDQWLLITPSQDQIWQNCTPTVCLNFRHIAKSCWRYIVYVIWSAALFLGTEWQKIWTKFCSRRRSLTKFPNISSGAVSGTIPIVMSFAWFNPVFRIRIGSWFNQASGFRSGSRRAKMTHKNRKS